MARVVAFLLFCLSLSPLSGRAEAQMRCAGAALYSTPCDHVELPATGLTETQADARLSAVPCCRALHGAMGPECPLQPHLSAAAAAQSTAARGSALAARHCVITIQVITSGASTLPVIHPRWFLTANPALAPPAPVCFVPVPASSAPASACASALSPHPSPQSHGLRAPPAA